MNTIFAVAEIGGCQHGSECATGVFDEDLTGVLSCAKVAANSPILVYDQLATAKFRGVS